MAPPPSPELICVAMFVNLNHNRNSHASCNNIERQEHPFPSQRPRADNENSEPILFQIDAGQPKDYEISLGLGFHTKISVSTNPLRKFVPVRDCNV